MARTEYGLQMYSLRDITKDDLKGALKVAADLGYKYIEFAGFFGHSAKEVKEWLDEYGLICCSTHTGVGLLTDENLDATLQYHLDIGCPRLIIPGADWSTEEKLNENLALFAKVQKKAAALGIEVGYHNHSGEFFVTPYGKVIEDEILAKTDLKVQIDTFWSFNAGLDSVAYLESIKDRVFAVHLKDGLPTAAENREWSSWTKGVQGKSLGSGEAPVAAVRAWCLANGMPMIVESEGLSPTGPEEVGRCITYLRTLD
ncbi:MAG: sugar phosphate isomerase/epimerase [Clostridia bacterium]|nr:sugar phosphate isomerase/epimerase [Clostridia bacterium]